MRKTDFIKQFGFTMLDEKDNIIEEYISFKNLPFIKENYFNENINNLIEGKSILVNNPLKPYKLKLYNIENVPKLTTEELLDFYLKNISNSDSLKMEKKWQTIVVSRDMDKITDKQRDTWEYYFDKYLVLHFNSNDQLLGIEYDGRLSRKLLEPLIFFEADYFASISQLCF